MLKYSMTNPVIVNKHCRHVVCLECKNLHKPIKCMACGGEAHFQQDNDLTKEALALNTNPNH